MVSWSKLANESAPAPCFWMSFQACCWASRRSSPVEVLAAWVVMDLSWVELCASKKVMISGSGA